MIDGIDYFPKREKYKKGLDQEWNELKKTKTEINPKTLKSKTKKKKNSLGEALTG